MTSDLITFLAKNPVEDMVQEVRIPGRLSEFPFKIKPMSATQFYKYQQIATKINTTGGSKTVGFNSARMNELVILNHVVEPNFKDAQLIEDMGVNTPEKLLDKYFLGGELIELSNKISEISGFGTSDTELETEAKNF